MLYVHLKVDRMLIFLHIFKCIWQSYYQIYQEEITSIIDHIIVHRKELLMEIYAKFILNCHFKSSRRLPNSWIWHHIKYIRNCKKWEDIWFEYKINKYLILLLYLSWSFWLFLFWLLFGLLLFWLFSFSFWCVLFFYVFHFL